MKTCTTLRVRATGEVTGVPGQPQLGPAAVLDAAIVDVSIVDDDHQFGFDGQGLLHIEGTIKPGEDVVAGG